LCSGAFFVRFFLFSARLVSLVLATTDAAADARI
jgi:hypothetical protein